MNMQKRIGRRGKAGETLTETLIAMLIIGLSSVLFITMIGASGRIFRKAETQYEEVYSTIAAADGQKTPLSESGKITVTGSGSPAEFDVKWYGDASYVLSYKVQ